MFKTTKFVQILSGYNHMLALTDKGVLYAWGSNTHGQLGTGDSKDRTKPTKLAFHTSSAVRTAAVGAFSSFAVTEDNTTFAWGYNENLELGLGEVEGRGGAAARQNACTLAKELPQCARWRSQNAKTQSGAHPLLGGWGQCQ